MTDNINIPKDEYKYGFADGDVSVYKTEKGINKAIVEEISRIKGEPDWMREFRVKSYEAFMEKPMPEWGADLSEIEFDEYTYYIKPSERVERSWDDVPETIKKTFEKLGLPEAEQEFLAGISSQYDSEVVYHNMLEEVEEKGVIFLDTDTALREHPELFKKYFYDLEFQI